jgi:hypothetical protein
MLHALAALLQGMFILSAFFLLLGLIRPVWVLWFLDRCNRMIAIRIYGGLGLVCFILWKICGLML